MKRFFALVAIVGILFSCQYCYGQVEEEVEEERILVLREAKLFRKDSVAVEAYLIDDILEVKVEARMYAKKPRINNVLLVGPRIGRLPYITKETIHKKIEEDDPYEVTKQHGLIVFEKRKKERKLKGTATREFYRLRIPKEKIVPGKRYRLWVEIESQTRGDDKQKFKFNIENLSELISQQNLNKSAPVAQ